MVDDSLTLQGKKDKIKSNLQRLAELGKVHPENRYQDLINDIAKVKKNKNKASYRLCLDVDDENKISVVFYINGFVCVCVTGHQKSEAVSSA